MYRVYLNATPEHPRREEWIDAVTVRPSWVGEHWEFIDSDGLVVFRLKKDRLASFERVTDRRKPRHPALAAQHDIVENVSVTLEPPA